MERGKGFWEPDGTELCTVLGVSISGYRAWQRGGTPRRRRLSDAQLLARGFPAGTARVERLMRDNGIRARHKWRYKATTDSGHRLPVAANLLERQFTPSAPNQV